MRIALILTSNAGTWCVVPSNTDITTPYSCPSWVVLAASARPPWTDSMCHRRRDRHPINHAPDAASGLGQRRAPGCTWLSNLYYRYVHELRLLYSRRLLLATRARCVNRHLRENQLHRRRRPSLRAASPALASPRPVPRRLKPPRRAPRTRCSRRCRCSPGPPPPARTCPSWPAPPRSWASWSACTPPQSTPC